MCTRTACALGDRLGRWLFCRKDMARRSSIRPSALCIIATLRAPCMRDCFHAGKTLSNRYAERRLPGASGGRSLTVCRVEKLLYRALPDSFAITEKFRATSY